MKMCKNCNGSGVVQEKECPLCEGAGVPLNSKSGEQIMDLMDSNGSTLMPGDPGFIEFEEDDYEY